MTFQKSQKALSFFQRPSIKVSINIQHGLMLSPPVRVKIHENQLESAKPVYLLRENSAISCGGQLGPD